MMTVLDIGRLQQWDSDEVRKAPFHLSELMDAEPQKKGRHDDTLAKPGR